MDDRAIIPSDYAMIRSFAGAREAVPHIEAEMRAPIAGTADDPIQLQRFERIEGHDMFRNSVLGIWNMPLKRKFLIFPVNNQFLLL